MSLSTSSRASGFTLLELMTGLAVSSVVLLGVAAAVIGQSRAYEANARTREAVSSARRALTFMESKVKLAGFGIHPQLAFGFVANSDSIAGPDRLIVRYRDPMFRRRGFLDVPGGAAGTNLTLDGPAPSTALSVGQILMLICPDGSTTAYVSVAGHAAGTTAVTLQGYLGAAGTGLANFPRQQPTGCLLQNGTDTKPFVVKVEEYQFDVAGNVLFMTRPGQVATPVITGVEDFQVAYVMNRPDPAWGIGGMPAASDTPPANWVFGDVTGVSEVPNGADTPPALNVGYRDPSRFTGIVSNIRGVRLSLVTQSDRDFESLRRRRPALENRPEAPEDDKRFRAVIATQVAVPNMAGRSTFAPVSENLGGG